MNSENELPKEDLEEMLEALYSEIGKYNAIPDLAVKKNVFKMKQRYDAFNNEYFGRFGQFYEPLSTR